MLKIGFLLLIFASGVEMYNQSDYILIPERIEMVSQNKNYIEISTRTFKYNRTQAVCNFTINFKKDFGYDLIASVESFKLASNEYRQFPMIFNRNMCNSLETNEFGVQNVYNCGNAPRCPATKGIYSICNWYPDYKQFPPYIPHGSYRIDVILSYKSVEIAHGQAFAIVKSSKFP